MRRASTARAAWRVDGDPADAALREAAERLARTAVQLGASEDAVVAAVRAALADARGSTATATGSHAP